MSWDIYLTEKFNTCSHCGRAEEEIEHFDRNYTNNMWPMLEKAGFSWDQIEGKTALEALPFVADLIGKMENDSVGYLTLNPPNGWGDFWSFLEMLQEFRSALIDHPTAIVHISR